ncbi:MAG: helix-turn-helix transcriptional regulator [Clostridia bacterium]|nr:helix-turn-helix transcriptional regulator [Clostridia bacterium]
MNLGEHIQQYRKESRLSQEELAEKVGVSRQAVSKWESNQSVPDLEHILTMSELFGVSVDELLKGKRDNPSGHDPENHAGIFTAVATAFNAIGIITAVMIWIERQTFLALGVGLILMAVGAMVFAIGQTICLSHTKRKAKYWFWMINIWFYTPVPIFMLSRFVKKIVGLFTPIEPFYAISLMGIALLVYLVIGIIVDLKLIKEKILS